MMNKALICTLQPGDRFATVLYVNGESVTNVPLVPQSVGEFLPMIFKIGSEFGCYDVRFVNTPKKMAFYYVQKAQKYALQNYKENEWTFTIMEDNK